MTAVERRARLVFGRLRKVGGPQTVRELSLALHMTPSQVRAALYSRDDQWFSHVVRDRVSFWVSLEVEVDGDQQAVLALPADGSAV